MNNNELVFATGTVVGVLAAALAERVDLPGWTSLITLPFAVWYVWRIGNGWYRRWESRTQVLGGGRQ